MTTTEAIETLENANLDTNHMARIAAYLRFKEPALTGGQLINRLLQAHPDAPNMPVYVIGPDGEKLVEVSGGVEIIEGKLIIF